MTSTLIQKETPTDFDIHPLIKERWSPRSFSQKKVSRSAVNQLLEAMRWAPSAMNEQPWEVLAAQKGTKSHDTLAKTLAPGNQPWAADAPVLLLVMARTTHSNGAPNHSALYDLGLAVGNLSIEATYLGLSLHQIGGFDRAVARESFNLRENLQPVVMIAVGYRDSHESLPEALQQRELAPRKRKKIEEFAVVDF